MRRLIASLALVLALVGCEYVHMQPGQNNGPQYAPPSLRAP
jgi:hypothetical protein